MTQVTEKIDYNAMFRKPLTADQIESNKLIEKNKELKQEDFFALLSKQLAYQDPFKPVENSEMISQMTGFSTSEGITKMGNSFDDMKGVLSSSQALEASSLVGKKVLIPSDIGYLPAKGGVDASISSNTGASDVIVNVTDKDGSIVRTMRIGDIGAGNQRFSWDGLDNDGERVEEGTYTFKTTGTVNGKGEELITANYAHVQSVSLGGGQAGVYLNLQGLGGIKLSDAIEVAENTKE